MTHFYGKDSAPTTPQDSGAENEEDEPDLATVVKRRRLNASMAAAEKEKRDAELREK